MQRKHEANMKQKPSTIENRWDILYSDYPEVYDEFASVPKDPPVLQALKKRVDFHDKVIADVGSGSGLSSFEFAKMAKKVIGVEVEDAMRELAERERTLRKLDNVEFIKGDGKNIPLPDDSVDVVTGITLAIYPVDGFRDFVREATRIAVNQGLIVMVNITPGWYGGELAHVIVNEIETDTELDHLLVNELGFQYEDFDTYQEYGSLDKIIRTYGFIFGKNVIDHLQENNKTNIKWRFRIHYKKVEK